MTRPADAVRRYLEHLALILTELGMSRMPARVFAALMTDDSGALTAAELAERLSVSPAAISGAVRYLDQIGLVVRRREPGERRDHFEVQDDLWYTTFLRRDRMLTQWRDAGAEGAQTLGPDTPAGRRLAEMGEFMDFMMAELPAMLERWHEHRDRG